MKFPLTPKLTLRRGPQGVRERGACLEVARPNGGREGRQGGGLRGKEEGTRHSHGIGKDNERY